MKFVSWNVNGFRRCLRHGFLDTFLDLDPDIFGMQDTRLSPKEVKIDLTEYYQYWNFSEEKRYDDAAVFTKIKPLAVYNGIGIPEFDREGRTITLEFLKFYYVNTFAPYAGEQLQRLDFRVMWAQAFRNYVTKLANNKPVIIGGDMSVAHDEIDLAEPEKNKNHAGFTGDERKEFTELLNAGFEDTFRTLHPKDEAYTYWSRYDNARDKNIGERLDYFLVSHALTDKVEGSDILNNIDESDHCPIELNMDIKTE